LPNLDPSIKENEATNKLENYLLSIRDDPQKIIYPNCHPTYNERHQKIIEMIDWTLEKYKANIEKTQQQNDEQVIIDNEVWKYSAEEDTIDYVLFRIREMTGRLI
jgi:hypothetical protein